MRRFAGQRGFTLVEILVATALFAIIMAIAFLSIRGAARQRDAVAESQERFYAIQRAVQTISRDLAQLQPRPVRDIIGDDKMPALTTGGDGQGIELTTGGWANPAGLPRSVLQRVAYQIEDDTLYRARWPVLDRTQGTLPLRRELLDGIVALQMRFFDASGQDHEDWPPLAGDPRAVLARRPRAIEFTMELEDFGLITRLIEVPQ